MTRKTIVTNMSKNCITAARSAFKNLAISLKVGALTTTMLPVTIGIIIAIVIIIGILEMLMLMNLLGKLAAKCSNFIQLFNRHSITILRV